jgi:RNA 2',3'-cyclic 3'-phosphodiesterase
MRLFIGIPLPDQYHQMLGTISKGWDDKFKSRLSWTKPGNWHLTLKFLGEVQEDKLPGLEGYMNNLEFPGFFLEGSGAGFFGSRGEYRLAWLGLMDDTHKLAALAGKIDHGLEALGFEREKRPFKGHLTLARVKKFYKDDPWDELRQHAGNLEWPPFEVRDVILWQSILSRSGARYEMICRSGLS